MDKALRQLREQIIASPDDVTLRRVYADWLAERGDPRGLFIQVQCELADSWLSLGRRSELIAVEQKLLHKHYVDWIRPALVGSPRHGVFVRGFLERWTCQASQFIARGNRVARSTPLRSASLGGVGDSHFAHLLGLRSFRGLESICLRGLEEWPRFWPGGGPRFDRLKHLSLSGGGWAWDTRSLRFEPWFSRLISSEAVKNLVSLELDLPLQVADGAALSGAPLLRQLRRLRLCSGFPRTVCPTGPAPTLEELDVEIYEDASSVQALLAAAPRLQSLTLRARTSTDGPRLGFASARATRLLIATLPAHVNTLSIWHCVLDAQTVDALVASELGELRLTDCRIAPPQLARLRARFDGFSERGTHVLGAFERARTWLGM